MEPSEQLACEGKCWMKQDYPMTVLLGLQELPLRLNSPGSQEEGLVKKQTNKKPTNKQKTFFFLFTILNKNAQTHLN